MSIQQSLATGDKLPSVGQAEAASAELDLQVELKAAQEQERILRHRADEILKQVNAIEQMGGCSTHLAHARAEAQAMQGTADQVRGALVEAVSKDASGKRTTNPREVAQLNRRLGEGIRAANSEKAVLAVALQEAQTKQAAKAEEEKKEKTLAQKLVQGACVASVVVLPPVAVVAPATGLRAWLGDLSGHSVAETARSAWGSVTQTAASTYEAVTNWAPVRAVADIVQNPSVYWDKATTAMSQATDSALALASTHIVAPAKKAVKTTVEYIGKAKDAAVSALSVAGEKVSDVASSAKQSTLALADSAAQKLSEMRDAAGQKIAALKRFVVGGGTETAVAATSSTPKPATVVAKPSPVSGMSLSALQRAVACALPLSLHCKSAMDTLTVAVPSLPSLHFTAMLAP